ncbi:MAG: YceI family protein [Aquabacterium sp.]
MAYPDMHHTAHHLPVALLLATLATTPVVASAQTLRPEFSELSFTIRQMGVPVTGQFKRFSAQIQLDPKRPTDGRVAFTIDTASAGFGAPEVDAEVPKPTWLAAANFPQARFQSGAIRSLGGGRFEVAGQLTIKGTARDVVVPVSLVQAGTRTTATGAFAIKRLAFKVGEGEWSDTSMVADEVTVRFKLALDGLSPL